MLMFGRLGDDATVDPASAAFKAQVIARVLAQAQGYKAQGMTDFAIMAKLKELPDYTMGVLLDEDIFAIMQQVNAAPSNGSVPTTTTPSTSTAAPKKGWSTGAKVAVGGLAVLLIGGAITGIVVGAR